MVDGRVNLHICIHIFLCVGQKQNREDSMNDSHRIREEEVGEKKLSNKIKCRDNLYGFGCVYARDKLTLLTLFVWLNPSFH